MKELEFRTNSRHIGQLGRELVTDFVTALVELVKNSYDADAGSVKLIIENANTPNSRIIIIDTGSGMTQEEFEKRWMVIGTNNKVSEPYTPKGRKKAGKKGIGRFSVERLAESVSIFSYTEKEQYKVSINWNCYEEISIDGLKQRIRILEKNKDIAAAKYIANQLEFYLLLPNIDINEKEFVFNKIGFIVQNYEFLFENENLIVLENDILPILKEYENIERRLEEIKVPLTEIQDCRCENTFRLLEGLYSQQKEKMSQKEGKQKEIKDKPTGVVLVLDKLRDCWRQKDIDKLQKELRLLVAPDFIEKEPFNVYLEAKQFSMLEELSVNDILDMHFAKVSAQIYDNGNKARISYRDKEQITKTELFDYEVPLVCGDLDFTLYYFLRDSIHLQNERNNYRFAIRVLDQYCGVKIYRDSFRVKPYGDNGNDWLELDKEKVKDTHGYRVGNNQTIGIIQISDDKNPFLVDATNREGIIENQAYEQLKEFVLKCILMITEIRAEEGKKAKPELEQQLEEKEKFKEEEKVRQTKRIENYAKIINLIDSGADKEIIKTALEEREQDEEKYQKKKEEQYEKTETAYKKVLDNQETELSMYKNLATLGILAGNFGHETQDIIARMGSSITFYKMFSAYAKNEHFNNVTRILEDDFGRITGYSKMIVEFLRRHKRDRVDNLDFGMVLNGICKLYVGMLNEFGIELSWRAEHGVYISMRQIDMESIIINLITNAFEQVKGKPERKIALNVYQDDINIYLVCEDSGSGVPQNKRKEIFNPFVTTKEDGIGLGLNIVRDIVENYSGVPMVEDSLFLGGARFCMQFKKEEEV